MLSVSSPLAGRASDDGSKRSAESRLIGEPRLKGHFRQRTSGVSEERLSPFDALQDEVAVRRRSKGLPERFREMAHGQATFTRQGREAERPVEMFGEQLSRAALWPRRETAVVLASGAKRRCVGVGHVRAKEKTEIVEKELGERWCRIDRGQHHLRHLMQHWVDPAMNALERPDPARLGIIRKRIEHGARHMIVDPVDGTGIARTRIGFQIVNAHAARRPLSDANMSIVDPDVASPLRRRCQVDGDDERSFRRNGRGPLRQTCIGRQMRDGDVWFQRRSNHKARCMREPKVLGHLLAVRWASVRFTRHTCLQDSASASPTSTRCKGRKSTLGHDAFESVLPQPVIQLRAGNAQLPRRPRFVSVNFPHGSLDRLALDDVQVCAVYHHWHYGRREA
jgi:hypothetical protein